MCLCACGPCVAKPLPHAFWRVRSFCACDPCGLATATRPLVLALVPHQHPWHNVRDMHTCLATVHDFASLLFTHMWTPPKLLHTNNNPFEGKGARPRVVQCQGRAHYEDECEVPRQNQGQPGPPPLRYALHPVRYHIIPFKIPAKQGPGRMGNPHPMRGHKNMHMG